MLLYNVKPELNNIFNKYMKIALVLIYCCEKKSNKTSKQSKYIIIFLIQKSANKD